MGQKFAAFNAQGNITAFYDDHDSPPPAGVQAIEITEEQWETAKSTPGYSVQDGQLTPPTTAALLGQARALQVGDMLAAYAAAIAQDVTFTTAAGVTKTFQADASSIGNAQKMVAAYGASGSVPAGFYWVSRDNTQVPFTLSDLQGLAKAMGDQGWAAFQQLQQRKASINAATTVAAVQAVAW